MRKNCVIVTSADDLGEGLFGQIILWTFEVLPYLASHGIFPAWRIKSKLYGSAPDYTVVPGLVELAYAPPPVIDAEVHLNDLRAQHLCVLGGDWHYMHALWNSYFAVPGRVLRAADDAALPRCTLGLHYRGTDKNQATWDTNPVSQDDFLTLVEGFLEEHPNVTSVFVASDEFSFVSHARQRLAPIPVINLGEVGFHKSGKNDSQRGHRAMLDCVLLSRCRYVVKCSSALSGFAKVLNPSLEAYRVSASKLFTDIAYFPEAYIPRLSSADPRCAAILEKQFAGDWRENRAARTKFERPFRARPRYTRTQRLIAHFKRLRRILNA
jgi:hypothetical protein